jgi:hypothetical protein
MSRRTRLETVPARSKGPQWSSHIESARAARAPPNAVVLSDLGELLISVLLIRKTRRSQQENAVSG